MSLHHCISQSFALPPATKPVSHLPYPLPPNQSVIWLALYHHITISLRHRGTTSSWHCITTSPCQSVICLAPCHQTSQSFALPPATKPVSHLTCPLPPCHLVSQSFALPPATKPVICLAPYHQISQSFDLPSTTTSSWHRITTWDFPHHMGMNLIG